VVNRHLDHEERDLEPLEGRAYLRSTIPSPVTTFFSRVPGRGYHRDIAPTWQGSSS
jgi:hypothetical protein